MRLVLAAFGLCVLASPAAAQSFCGKPPLVGGETVVAINRASLDLLRSGADVTEWAARVPGIVDALGAAHAQTPRDDISGTLLYNLCAALETSLIDRAALLDIIRGLAAALAIEPPHGENTLVPRDALGQPLPRR